MQLYSTFCILFCFTFFQVPLLQAQQYQLTKRFTPADGLADMVTYDGITDAQGYLWIATNSGLSRYDGHSFKNFHQNSSDSTALCSNEISDFYVDKDSILWIATTSGLAKYDPEKEEFQCFSQEIMGNKVDRHNTILEIYQDEEGVLWLGIARRGLCRFDPQTQEFKTYILNKATNNKTINRFKNTVRSIIQDVENPDILWMAGVQAGIYTFNRKTEQLIPFQLSPLSIKGNKMKTAEWISLYMDQEGGLWAGSWGAASGLYKIDTQTGNWEEIPLPQKAGVLDIKAIDKQYLYIATYFSQGVLQVDRKTYDIHILYENQLDQRDQDNIRKIHFDSQQRLWAFSTAGVLLFDPLATKIPKFQIPDARYVTYIAVDQNDDYLIATTNYQNKFHQLSADKQTISSNNLPESSTQYRLRYAAVDCKGNVWFTDDTNLPRIWKYNSKDGQFNAIKYKQSETFEAKHILIADDSCNLWLSVGRESIFKYDINRDTFINITRDNPSLTSDSKADIRKLFIDSRGYLWITTQYNGIHVFDTQSNEPIKHFAQDSEALVNGLSHSIAETTDHKIWVSVSRKGIFEIEPDDGWSMKLINQQQGLPSNHILDLATDDNGDIWMASYQGFIKYDYTTKNFTVYSEEEGVSDLFNWGLTLKKTKKGEIFLGGQKGDFYLFHPDSLPFNEQVPKLVFTDFKVAGASKSFDKTLNYLSKIVLPYEENFFSIHFAALNFTEPENNRYQYYLEGYDKDWVDNKNLTFASYTNVKEGKYTFRLRAANNDGVWNGEGISIPIQILPPWYRTWWAYLFYLIGATALGFVAYRVQLRRQILKRQLVQEQEQINRLKEIDEAKTQFYTNITHEFRTPLTVILGLAEELQVHPAVDWKKRLQIIHRNGDQLLQLINQMLDLSKLKSGMLQPNYVQGDIVLFIRYLTESYQSFAMNQQKNLAFFSIAERLVMDYDPEKMESIVGNLLSNAIKFTPQYGKIKVRMEQVGQDLLIKVIDTGIGIPKAEIAHIFDRFYQVEAEEKHETEGTGIGLALVKEMVQLLDGRVEVSSELHEGTTFEVYLPIRNNAVFEDYAFDFKRAEIVEQETTTQKTSNLANVLLIEDNSDVRNFIKITLEKRFNVLEARDGQQGLQMAISEQPDLIISDVMMPLVDGFEVVETLRKDSRTKHIPIILLTAKSTQEDKVKGIAKGADSYLQKPFNRKELLAIIEQLLKNKKRFQQYFQQTKNNSNAQSDFLTIVQNCIQENLDNENFGLLQLQQATRLSRVQLYRKVKALTNQSPSELIRSTRMKAASNLIENSDLSINEIAFQVGFKDTSHFIKTYKKHFKKTPNETRKNL